MGKRSVTGTLGRTLLWVVAVSAIVVAAYAVAAPFFEFGSVPAPRAELAPVHRLSQGWDDDIANRYHHESQGTKIMPLAWLMALEQPVLTLFPVGRFAARDYLARFGFVYATDPPAPGVPDLPIGWAVEEKYIAKYDVPPVETPTRMVGLSCAACHTSRINVERPDGAVKSVLIEGGSAMIDLGTFEQAVGKALAYTSILPMRFARFARNVLGADLADGDPRRQKLRGELTAAMTVVTRLAGEEQKYGKLAGGFSRTDALARIGNRVFGVISDENLVNMDAPVNFPHLWDTPWFDWVQYDASVRTPMTRNIGESLGVGAVINLKDPQLGLYESTVNVQGLHWLEDQLGGDNPFEGLQPPRWDDMVKAVFGEAGGPSDFVLNPERVRAGEVLYAQHCQYCHLPPRRLLKADFAKGRFAHFTDADPGSGKRFIKLKVVDLSVIGTDPNQAVNFFRRHAVAPAAKFKPPKGGQYGSDWYTSDWVRSGYPAEAWSETISGATGLFQVTSFVRRKKYQELGLLAPPDASDAARKQANDDPCRKRTRILYDRFRSVDEALDLGDEAAILFGRNMEQFIVANLGYKARPLDGIWATPPYLHNSSVPNLYQMLVPAARRFTRFYLGSTRFDPKHVGYETHQFPAAFLMDTTKPGNRNTGHEFRNLTLEELEANQARTWDGRSSREERWALVLGVDLQQLGAMPAEERWKLTRDATRLALENPMGMGIKGVLGPEFTEEERWRLVEFLKSL
jgi:mono/diheme cytochrome c family protein